MPSDVDRKRRHRVKRETDSEIGRHRKKMLTERQGGGKVVIVQSDGMADTLCQLHSECFSSSLLQPSPKAAHTIN